MVLGKNCYESGKGILEKAVIGIYEDDIITSGFFDAGVARV